MLYANQGQPREALLFFDRALELAPGFVEARRFRAILLARAGDWERASQDINWCLEKEPSGPNLYAAACIVAVAAGKSTDSATANLTKMQALDFLQKAFAKGYGREQAAQDPDLESIRHVPEFVQLLKSN